MSVTEDEFTRLFKYVEDFRNEVNTKLDEKASQSSLDRLTNTVDAFIKRLDNTEIDQAARDRQFDRLVAWARDVSVKTGIPLKDL